MLPFRAKVDLGAMAMKGCSAFPKSPKSLEPHHQIFSLYQDTHWGTLPLCRGAVSVFYSPSRLGNTTYTTFNQVISNCSRGHIMQFFYMHSESIKWFAHLAAYRADILFRPAIRWLQMLKVRAHCWSMGNTTWSSFWRTC